MKKIFLLLAALPLVACSKDGGNDGFIEPQIVFTNLSPGAGTGGARFVKLMPSPEKAILEIGKEVARTLYATDADANRAGVKKITVIIDPNYIGVAEKTGEAPEVTLRFSATYIQDHYPEGYVGNDEKTLAEIKGTMYHEFTHAYAYVPTVPGADYGDGAGTPVFAFVEGMADAVRPVLIPYADGSVAMPGPGGETPWLQGYKTTGFFLKWLKDNKDDGFLRKFNASAHDINPWSWDAAIASILGAGVTTRSLWDEYQASFVVK